MFTRRLFLSYFAIINTFIFILIFHQPANASPDGSGGEATKANRLLAGLPLYFEANRGQVHEKFDYLARSGGLRAYIGPAGAVMSLRGTAQSGLSEDGKESRWNIELTITSDNLWAEHRGEKKLPGKVNYFKGSKAQWKTDIPTYGRVRYKQVLPGIDVAYYGDGRSLEYDFVVAPGADPGAIALKFSGQSGLSLDEGGNLVLLTGLGKLVNKRPIVYQEKDGRRRPIEGSYKLLAADTVGFDIGDYDNARPLIIDPEILYCGYIGGSGDDRCQGIAVDSSGAAYVTGFASSTEADFPVNVGPGLTHGGGTDDAFAAKISADGSSLVYCGYIGGSGDDYGYGIAVDSSGAAYVTGYTTSTEASFPVVIGPDLNFNGGWNDAFAAKISVDGSSLIYCGYIGGSNGDYARGIAVDSSGAAYVAGGTQSDEGSFPVNIGPSLIHSGGPDAFAAKISVDGSSLIYCGYIGGSGDDYARGIAVDSSGAAYVTGGAESDEGSFPVNIGPSLTHNGGLDAFAAKVSADGSSLVYCGYIGGSRQEVGYGIAVDSSGAAYVAGETESNEGEGFPVTVGPDLNHNGNYDAFAAKISADGSSLAYCGYIGGSGGDNARGIAVDSSGAAYVTGYSESDEGSFPVVGGPDLTFNGGTRDAFAAKVSADGSFLVYCGYIGGSGVDEGQGIAVDSSGAAYVTGYTASTEASFPVAVGPGLTHNGGNRDAFAAKIGDPGGGGGDRPRQPGGPTDQFGGGGNNPPPLNLTGAVTTITPRPGLKLFQTRMLPLANPGGAGGSSAKTITPSGWLPGLVVQLASPEGASLKGWLPLEGTAATPMGVSCTTELRYNYDVQVVDLTLDWSTNALARLTPGRWTITYWFQTEAGARSNNRREYLDVTTGSSAKGGPIAAAPTELIFNLLLSVFSSATGQAAKVTNGAVQVYADDSYYDVRDVASGRADVRVPFGKTSRIYFESDQFQNIRTLRCEFTNGILQIIDEDDASNTPVAYYKNPDGEGYCLEYYRNKLYICNPCPSGGPIMGRLYGK